MRFGSGTLALVVIMTTNIFARQEADSVLPLRRIFFKPYLAGTRPEVSSLSPDGKLLLYQWDSTARGRSRSWLMNSDGSGAREIADTLVGEAEWSPDSKKLACTRQGDLFLTDTAFHTFDRLTKTDASEYGLRFSRDGRLLCFSSGGTIMAMPVNGHGIDELYKPSEKDASANLIDFTPDGTHIVFSEYNREKLTDFLIPRYTGKQVETRSFKGGLGKSRIGIAPVDTGRVVWIKLPGEERFYTGDVVVSPDGKSILVERYTEDRKKREIYRADTDSGKAALVYDETDKAWVEGGLATTRWMPDGSRIITTSEREGWNHLYSMDPSGKDRHRLTQGTWEVHWFDISPDGRRIFFQANRESRQQWQLYALDVKSGEIARLSHREGSYESPVMSKDGSFIIAGYSEFTMPAEIERIATEFPAVASKGQAAPAGEGILPGANAEVQLTRSVPEEFTRRHWITPEILRFKASDGTTVPAMVYKPAHMVPGKKYPVVVFVHGAGYLQNVVQEWSYYYREYMFHNRLVQRGYVVFEVDYRGSAGYGRDFRADVSMHLGGKDLQDELDGLKYLQSLGYIDTSRVGIYGGSYGGFMALMGLFRSDAYACGAALRAVSSWENYYRHNQWYTEARLGKPETDSTAYRISSPLTYADSLKKPLLILHGMVDDNVFFQDAVQLIKALQKSGKKFETMMYPDESHSFSEPESWYDEYSRIEEFFDRYLLPGKN